MLIPRPFNESTFWQSTLLLSSPPGHVSITMKRPERKDFKFCSGYIVNAYHPVHRLCNSFKFISQAAAFKCQKCVVYSIYQSSEPQAPDGSESLDHTKRQAIFACIAGAETRPETRSRGLSRRRCILIWICISQPNSVKGCTRKCDCEPSRQRQLMPRLFFVHAYSRASAACSKRSSLN